MNIFQKVLLLKMAKMDEMGPKNCHFQVKLIFRI